MLNFCLLRQSTKGVCVCTQLVMSSEDEETPVSRLRPHRCNARVEDLLQSLFTLEFSAKVRPAWRNVRACLKSEPGQEPVEPYLVVKDPDLYLNPDKMTLKRGRE